MISALVAVATPVDADAIDRLADTLSALVAGVAGGLVGDAVIVTAAAAADGGLATVAEATGATLVLGGDDPWAAAARAARRDWVLCLEAGDVPAEGWIRTIDRFVGTARSDAVLGRLRRPHAGWAVRLGRPVERLIGARTVRAGDVLRRDRLARGGRLVPRLTVRLLIGRIDRP